MCHAITGGANRYILCNERLNLPSVARRPSPVARRPSPIAHRPSSIVYRLSSIVRPPPSVVRRSAPESRGRVLTVLHHEIDEAHEIFANAFHARALHASKRAFEK